MRRWGSGAPAVVVLHGLGATGAVWRRVAEVLVGRVDGAVVAPDLPGHGRSPGAPPYSFGAMADAVAAVLPDGWRGPVAGHSLGGVVALALAGGGFGVAVTGVAGLGIKVAWTDEELARAAALGARPVATFATEDEAWARYRRVAGLEGVAGLATADVADGVRPEGDGWRLAQDPATFAVGAPDMGGLLAAAGAHGVPVVLARGETDALVTDAQLATLVPDPVSLPGAGHNAQLDTPGAVADLVVGLRREPPAGTDRPGPSGAR